MKARWVVYPSLFDWGTCNDIVSYAQRIKPVDAYVGGDKNVNKEIRSSTVRWINHENDDFADVFKTIERLYKRANSEKFGVDITYLPPLQFTTYHEANDGHYDWHEDVFWESDNVYDRKLSMVIQLSDPNEYEGGVLEFQNLWIHPNPEDYRPRGSVIIFPSFVRHRVTPVTKGVRHSLVSWIQGPTWR